MLTPYERTEILRYSAIYHLGFKAEKKIWGVVGGPRNGGYDDDQNCYRVVPNDHIAYRYEVIHILGKGSFGQVSTLPL